MRETDLYPRFAADRLTEALEDSPAVLIHGPRQSGKTTLAQRVGRRAGYGYLSFDDEAIRSVALADPVGFVADLPPRVILDEVQHVPQLFVTLKAAIDRDRRPGRFVLTGSTNVLLLPKLSDSLAGRMAIVRLHPLAQCEIERKRPSFLERLFGAGFKMHPFERLGPGHGGTHRGRRLPCGAQASSRPAACTLVRSLPGSDRATGRTRTRPHRIARCRAAPAGCGGGADGTAGDLAAPFAVSRPTIRDYLTLLSRVFLLEELPPWHVNRLSRLVKTPKLHVGDTGLACALLGADVAALKADRALLGQLLETFVLLELRRQASGHKQPLAFHHFRDRDGYEVDIVIERGALAIAGIEVKAAATVTAADFRGLRKLKDAAGRRFAGGVVLYDGTMSLPFGDSMYAVPIRALWEAP
jgi:hypothetical protein